MKNKKVIIVLLVLILVGVLGYFGVKKWIDKNSNRFFKVTQVKVTIERDSIFLNLRVKVPDTDIATSLLDSLEYEVYFDTVQFSHGMKVFSGSTQISDSIIDLPLGMDRQKLFSRIKEMQTKDSTDLVIKMRPHVSSFLFGKHEIPFNITRTIPVPIPPEVTVDDVDLEKFSLNDPELSITLQLVNLNAFEFIIWSGDIYLDFIDLFYGKVVLDDPVHLKNFDTTKIATNIYIEEMKAFKTGWKMLLKKEDVSYKMKGTLLISDVKNKEDTIKVFLQSEVMKLR